MENKKIKILLVEDDTFLLKMYADKFESEDYDTLLADNGLKAITTAKENLLDVILLDVMLPKMDGFEVLEKLKADAKTKNIPVILLTNLSQKEEVQKGLKLGAKGFLVTSGVVTVKDPKKRLLELAKAFKK